MTPEEIDDCLNTLRNAMERAKGPIEYSMSLGVASETDHTSGHTRHYHDGSFTCTITAHPH